MGLSIHLVFHKEQSMAQYCGFPSTSIENEFLRVELLSAGAMRVAGLYLAGVAHNLLGELDLKVPTPYGDYPLVGGHRLWHAPEAMPRTYLPEDPQPQVENLPFGIRIRQAAEAQSGIRKTMELRLLPGRAALTIDHTLENTGIWPVECAPWAITLMPLGGTVFFPLRDREVTSFLPDRQLVVWPYSHLSDERLHWGDDQLRVLAKPMLPPLKLGTFNSLGWLAYFRDGVLFRKSFTPMPGRPHVDMGCNAEIYNSDRILELESIAPLTVLQPGESVGHRETWDVTHLPDVQMDAEGLRKIEALLRP